MPYDEWFDSDENRMLMAICTRKLIRNIGIGAVIWGLINIGIGAVAMQETVINAGILILGVMMLGTGVQALRRPTLGVLLTETIVTVLLLAWNVSMAVLNGLAGEAFDPRGLVFPLVIVIVFARNYTRLRHLRDLIATVPSDKIDATKQVCKTIIKKKLKDEPLIIQTTNRKCRAQLMDEQALFIQRDLMRAFVATREAIVAAVAKPEARSWMTVFSHPLGTLKYRFDKKNTEKLRAWATQDDKAAGS